MSAMSQAWMLCSTFKGVDRIFNVYHSPRKPPTVSTGLGTSPRSCGLPACIQMLMRTAFVPLHDPAYAYVVRTLWLRSCITALYMCMCVSCTVAAAAHCAPGGCPQRVRQHSRTAAKQRRQRGCAVCCQRHTPGQCMWGLGWR
eukprot:scaffold141941_cov22-Tisochrysis_lutea.AAC.4